MSKKDDGGPAFPVVPTMERSGQWGYSYLGMSLRAYAAIKLRQPDSGIDWLDEMIHKAKLDDFAGQATPEDVRRHRFENPDGSERLPTLTVEQAKYADAMLAERSKP